MTSQGRKSATTPSCWMSNNIGAAMRPQTAPQQNARGGGILQAASKRKGSSTQGIQTWPSSATEYQERFLPPSCYKTCIPTSKQNPKHQPNGSSGVTTFQSLCVAHRWTKNTPKSPSPAVKPKDCRRYKSAPHDFAHFDIDNMDYTTVYRSDFKSWNTNRQPPFKHKDTLKVRHGLVVTDMSSDEQKKSLVPLSRSISEEREPQPIESITSYRADYIPHEVLSRPCRVKHSYQKREVLLSNTATPSRPTAAMDGNQVYPEGNRLFQEFKTCSLVSSPQPDYQFHSNTPAADKPILPSIQTSEEKHGVFQTMTSLKEDCKGCDAPHLLKARPAVDRKTITKSSRLLPRMHSSCNTTIEFSGIKCSTGNGKTRVC